VRHKTAMSAQKGIALSGAIERSKRLRAGETAKIHYMRGYARTKACEAGASFTTLSDALKEFRKCKVLDPNHSKAPSAIEKITKQLRRRRNELWADVIGPALIFIAGLMVFIIAQADFFYHLFQEKAASDGFLQPSHVSISGGAAEYVTLTFGALLFMIAALSLCQSCLS
jgi:hypothetical protein